MEEVGEKGLKERAAEVEVPKEQIEKIEAINRRLRIKVKSGKGEREGGDPEQQDYM